MQWWRESRYSTSQLQILFGIGSFAILFINDECRTESNALEKSSPIKCMNSYFHRSTDILCSSLIKTAVVDPVGRSANWSWKRCLKSGCTRTGYRYLWIIIFSKVRDNIDVTEIGLKSSHFPGWLCKIYRAWFLFRKYYWVQVEDCHLLSVPWGQPSGKQASGRGGIGVNFF